MDHIADLATDPYEQIAEFYDLEHADFRADIDLLLSFAGIVGDPILEVGCGSGRILVSLARAGFDVTGIDCSSAMLRRAEGAAARSGVTERTTLANLDMTQADVAPGGPFGLAIFSLNALMHLTTPQRQLRALESTFAALDPKGQLIIDSMNPTPLHLTQLDAGQVLEGSWTDAQGTTIDKWSHRRIQPSEQRIETTIWYDRFFPDGRYRRTRTQLPLRYVHAAELELMLRIAGFSEIRIYGSYDLDPFDDESERLLVTAEVTPSESPVRSS